MDKKNITIEKLFRSDGKLNSAVVRQKWFQESDLLKHINEETSSIEDASLAERVYLVANGMKVRPKCPSCEGDSRFIIKYPYSYMRCLICSSKAAALKRLETNMERYGSAVSPNTVESARARASELNRKGRETLMKRYGVKNPGQLASVKERMKELSSDPEHRKKRAESMRRGSEERHQALAPSVKVKEIGSIRERVFENQHNDIVFECLKCERNQTIPVETFRWRARTLGDVCVYCSGVSSGSTEQKAFYERVLEFAPDAVYNDRTMIAPYEIDIYIPSARVGIEYHGIFWHSQHDPKDLDQKQHLRKLELCEKRGITLIQHCSEHNLEGVISVIKNRLGLSEKLFARKCSVIELEKGEAESFLEKWHVKGSAKCKVAFGLKHGDEIRTVMTFDSARFQKNVEWELIRLAHSPGTTVVGGASRLLRAFERAYSPKSIVSYADRFTGTGSVYKNLGFDLEGVTRPGYSYWRADHGMLSRHRAQKHLLAALLGELFDPSKTEVENMLNAGWRIFYDAGNYKYIKRY